MIDPNPVLLKEIEYLQSKLHAACDLLEYVTHSNGCIRTMREAGEPMPDGGYRTKFAGKWYQSLPVNEEPKCDCGLDEARANEAGVE